MSKKTKKIHLLESFCYADIYKEYGIVWQLVCRKMVNIEQSDVQVTTKITEATCKKCLDIYDTYGGEGTRLIIQYPFDEAIEIGARKLLQKQKKKVEK